MSGAVSYKVCGCGSGLKTQPEGQALSKIGVLGVIDSGKQKSPPSFASCQQGDQQVQAHGGADPACHGWITRVYTDGAYTFQQSSVPTHTTEKTEEFLKLKNMKVTMMELWPLLLPDFSILESSIWVRLEAKACPSLLPEARTANVRHSGQVE